MRLINLATAVVLSCIPITLHAQQWSWQKPHVEITETGDLKWKPESFTYTPGTSVRYIDYENGNDSHDGTSVSTPWKHHPWDPAAEDKAKDASGIHTYVFKRGVTYRGELIADESGTTQNRIQLTSDPNWGDGDAKFYGSELITSGWQQGSHADMPNGSAIWYKDLAFAPRCVWMVEGETITPLKLARTPNWEIVNPDDIKSQWWKWERCGLRYDGGKKITTGVDEEHLTESGDYYENAVVWVEWSGPTMGMPYAVPVLEYDTSLKALKFPDPAYGSQFASVKTKCRYYLEDKPHYLDTDGEFWFEKNGTGGRLYVRLPGDKNPDAVPIEAGRYLNLIELGTQSHITISGITFRFTNLYWDITANAAVEDARCAAVRMLSGSGSNITIRNCNFEHVNQAARIEAYIGSENDTISITDNQMSHIDHAVIEVKRRDHVEVLRNKIYNMFKRTWTGAHGFGLCLDQVAHSEAAGNIIHRAYGAGIFVVGRHNAPFVRNLIHHNKVTDPMLSCCDWGGIEPFGSGPTYIYNNISGNPGGYRHYAGKNSFGHCYYIDGTASKNYLFNCVAWGKYNDPNDSIPSEAGIMHFIGLENAIFNNTIYKFMKASRRQVPEAQRNYYIGNLYMDMTEWVFFHAKHDKYGNPNEPHVGEQDTTFNYKTAAYTGNVFYKVPENFGVFEADGSYYTTIENFKKALEHYKTLKWDVGTIVDQDPVKNAAAHDFRLSDNSPAINKGAQVFVPWPLYTMVGEWNFHRNNEDPTHIIDHHWYMAPYYRDRHYHRFMPRYPLSAMKVTASDFVDGNLETWTQSALMLNGIDQYAVITNENIRKDVRYPMENGRQGIVSGHRKVTPDMEDNNFLIEVYLKTTNGHTGGLIIGKADATGYVLDIDQSGKVRFRLRSGGADVAKRTSTEAINDGNWRHVIAEVDRSAAQGIRIYVDGKVSNGAFEGTIPTGSISNTADLLVGGGPGQTFLEGTLDFLRISRGTLADAKTTIEELYAWQFSDGPQFFDFMGNRIEDKRDAGAFEAPATGIDVNYYPGQFKIGAGMQKTANTVKNAAQLGVQSGITSQKSSKNKSDSGEK